MIHTIVSVILAGIILCPVLLQAQTDSLQTTGQADSTQNTTEEQKAKFSYVLSPSIGITFQNISKSDEETLTAQWLANIQARMQWEGRVFGLSSSLYLQYGQLHREGIEPEKTQDNLIASITPSVAFLPSIGVRVFLETTAETQMKEGRVDTVVSRFLDPLFVYQTLFIGQKINSTAEDGTGEFNFIYGLGYAVQQTITDKFILESNRRYKLGPDNPLSNVQDQVTLESGISGVIDINARKQIGESFQFNTSIKVVMLGKEKTWTDYTKARVGSLALLSLSYGVFNLEYNMRLLYDSNYSLRRQIDQSLVAGLKINL